MKDFITKPANFNKIEFWGATTIYVFSVFFLISHAVHFVWSPNTLPAEGVRTPFDYYFVSNLIRYTVLYGSFLLMNFKVMPALIQKEALWLNIFFTLVLFLVMGLLFGVVNTFLKYAMLPEAQTNLYTQNALLQGGYLYAAWLLLLFTFYSIIKYTGLYLLTRSETIHARYGIITPGGLVAFVLWMIFMFFLIVGNAPIEIIAGFAIVIPSGIVFYWFAFYSLIPKSLVRKKPFRSYMLRNFLILLVSIMPLGLLAVLMTGDEDGMGIGMFNAALHFFVTAPVTWFIFKRQMESNEELRVLKKELGQSNANFDFLRSQINPHFLFNALNTLYGTALQENAERTSEGVQRLGDMMRFMLQENMQEKISLAREIEYLHNYISLQRLRTDSSPCVKIEANIEEPLMPVQIAPMLLIPFVENAFKHGISLREPSHIKVLLEMREKTLFFDVYNSKHTKQENDPEKHRSGIGLSNVKQRLKLLYPARHELIVRETAKEFFIHLTIELS